VIIGGLLTKDNSSLARRVPFLSDIPILGYAFRYDLDVERRNELLIILTPQVIKDDEDAELLKQVEARRMNWVLSDVVEMQGDIGVYEDDEEQDAAHAHEHLQPEMELSAPTEAPAPPPEPGHDAINYRNAQPDGQPQASTPKRRGSLARALGKLRFKPTSAREAVEKRRRGKKVLPQDKQGAVAKAAPNSTRRAPAAAARRSANPWHALKEQTVLPASRWQELEEIKKGVHSETTSD
jgi:hypothetical protein